MNKLCLLGGGIVLALALANCSKSSTSSVCPTSGTAASGAGGTGPNDAYTANLGTTYEAGIPSSSDVWFQFNTTSTGSYSGCLGTTVQTDMAYDLENATAQLIGTCNNNSAANPSERCSTADFGVGLVGGNLFFVRVYDSGPIFSGTFTLTITKD